MHSKSFTSACGDHSLACDTLRVIDLSTTGQIAKATPGVLHGYYLANNAATARFVKLYNKATAPTGADTPLATLELPASSAANVWFGPGIAFSAGISVRGTQLVADADATAPAANDLVVNLFFK